MGKRKEDPTNEMRDELYSHIQRCGVLDATAADQKEWLADTIEYLRERYFHLTDLQVASVKAMARRYIKPAIPHGAGFHALNRERWESRDRPQDMQLAAG